MDSGGKFLTFTSIIILAVILQGVLVIAEQRETPDKAAVEFARAYFWLDYVHGGPALQGTRPE